MRGLPPIARWLRASSAYLRRIACVAGVLFLIVSGAAAQQVIVDPNVNMVRGTTFPVGDPYLQRQNEPSIAISTRNPCHLVAGANDYRSVDIPFDDTIPPNTENNLSLAGDAWLGLFKSFDCGTKWQSSLLPGYPQDNSNVAAELKGHAAGADPTVRAGTNGLFYYSGMVFNRGSSGTSKIFMARLIDNNNKERGDPIEFLGVSIVDTGTKGQFLDKPWMAVDVPRAGYGPGSQLGGNQTCVVNGQTLPAGNVYMAWAKFTGTSNQHSKLMFAKSSDCGVTWKQHPITNNQSLSQGANIAVAPHDGTIYLTWREFSAPSGNNKPVNFWIVSSSDGGESFSAPKKIASDVITFDQPRSTSTFRSNALPAIVADHQDRVYVAWSGRGYAWTYGPQNTIQPNDDARIVMVMSSNRGQTFTPVPFPIDPSPTRGHQMMPSLSFAAGKIQAIWYDAREDVSGVFDKYIDDKQATVLLHTIDVRGAQAIPASPPVFVADSAVSLEISKYRKWNLEIKDSTGHVTGYESKEIGSNPPNLPMYANGTTPFIGDYIDVSGLPAFPVQTTGGQLWQPNIGPLNLMGASAANLSTSGFPTLPTFHATWTDNRDVRVEQCRADPNNPSAQLVGQRNANIYTARLTKGLYVGSPGNTKPFGYRLNPKTKQQELIQRGFVVFAQNTTESLKFFRFKIENQPLGGRASFNQFDKNGPLTEVIVAIPAVSTVARTLYAKSTDVNAQILVNIEQHTPVDVTPPGQGNGEPKQWSWIPEPDGLKGSVLLNPDRTNPAILDPDVLGDVPQIATQEVHNPSMFDAQFYKRTSKSRRLDVLNAQTPDPENPDPENPDPENPDPENPDAENPDPENPDPENPDPENPDPENPDPENPDPENALLENSAISDAEVANSTITDIQWRVHNSGNTTSAYKFRPKLPQTFSDQKYQLIVTRRSMALALGADCKPVYKSTNQVLVNIVNFTPKTPDPENPDAENPDPENPDAENPDPENPDPENATFFLAPEETATVTLRVFDTDPDNNQPAPDTREEVAAKTAAQAANTGETKVSSAVAGPDLTLFDVPATVSPAVLRPGKQATVTFTLSNRGTGNAVAPAGKQIKTRIYFSADQEINNGDTLLAEIIEPSPFAFCDGEDLTDACSTVSQVPVIPPPVPGTSYVIIITDEDGDIFEADELNNLIVVPIVVANYQLSFLQQPTDATQDFTITPPVVVALSHPDGLAVEAIDVPTVTLAIQNNPSDPAATLSGTKIQSNINGFATFNDLKINVPAAGFTLSASAPFSSPAVSAAFNIETDLPPVTVNDSYTTNEETALSPAAPGVLTNDSDPPTKGVTPAAYVFDAVKETDPSNGTVAVNANGSFTYTPSQNFAGNDSFTYRARDGRPGNFTIGIVSIAVVNVNDAPGFTKGADQVANEDAGAQTVAGWATNISAGPQNEAGQIVDFAVTNDNNALFSAQPFIAGNGTLTFTGAANASGTATVTVRIHDNGGTANNGVDTSAPQTFTITIAGVNDAPVATADSYSINEDGSLVIDAGQPVNNHYPTGLLANDTDTENSLLVVEYLTLTTNGTLLPHANGSFSYTPNPNFFGTDSFTYRASDGATTGNTVTVTITVAAVNDAPSFVKGANQFVATNSPAQSVANWAAGISSGPANESAQLVDFIVTNDNNAIFTVQPAVSSAGTLTYTPKQNQSGTATVTIRIHDSGGTANGGVDTSAPQTFTIAITSAPQTYVVINTNDSGAGSLRAALINANLNASADTITFNIPGAGVRTITPLTPLPSVVFPVVINATTQPGYAGTPLIELNGASAGAGANGFTLNATNVTIRGFKITGFGAAGVAIIDPGTGTLTGNKVSQNSIVNNGGLGIDLIPTVGGNPITGVTANDALDGDNGPNGLQNFPVVTGAFINANSTSITGSLNSAPNTAYAIELFSSTAADPSGYGEGQTYLTTLTATTDGSGNATFATTWAAALSGFVTATATDPNGNTSEFSQARVASNDEIFTVNDFAMTTNPAANDIDPNVANPSVRTTYKALAGNNPSLLSPGEVAVIAQSGRAYFTGGNQSLGTDGRIGLVDLATNTISAVTQMKGNVGASLTRVNQATQIVYMRAGLNLIAIDGRAASPTVNQAILNINLGAIQSMALDSVHSRLYLTTTTTGSALITNGRVTEIDIDPNSATFHQVVDEVTVPSPNGNATAIAVNPATGKVYVAVTGSQAGLYVGDPQAQTMTMIFQTNVNGLGNITSIAVNDIDNVIYAVGTTTLHAIDGATDTRVATIPLAASASAGNLDTRLGIDRSNGRVFVRLGGFPNPSNLVIVDGKKTSPDYNKILTTVNLGRENGSATMAVDETGHRVIATSPQDLRAHIIDATNPNASIVATIMSTQPASRVTINPTTRRAYLSGLIGFIKVVDMATASTVTDVHVGTEEFGLAIDPTTHSAYVSETGLGTAVRRLAETGILGSVPLPHVDGREEFAIRNSVTNKIYVLNGAATAAGGSDALPGFVHVIDGSNNTVTASVPVGANPFGLAVDEANNKIFAGNGISSQFTGGISIINGLNNQVTAADMSAIGSSVSVGRDMVVITSGPTAGRLYFRTLSGVPTQSLGMLNGTIASQVNIGNVNINIIRYNPVLNRLYVGATPAAGGANQVFVIDPTNNQIVTTLTLGSPTTFRTNQSYIGVNSTTGRVFISDFEESKLVVVNGNTNAVEATLAMPFGPSAVGVDEAHNRIYVGNAIARSMTIVDGSTLRVVRSLALPIAPVQLDVDSSISPARIFAQATGNEGAISVIDDPATAAPPITSVTQGAHGSVVLNADGSVTYTPNAGYTGADSYTYTTSGGTSTANVTVLPNLTIATASLPNTMVGQSYSQTLAATGGVAPYTWTISGFAPGGLHLSANGVLSGVTQQAGTFTFTVTVRDSHPLALTESKTFTILAGPLTIAPSGLSSATINTPYSAQLFAGGAQGQVTWTLNTFGHPGLSWLSISQNGGMLSGTPNAYGTTASFAVTATDSTAPVPQSNTRTYTIFVGGPLTMADLREGVVLETQPSVSFLGGTGTRGLTADANNPLQAKLTSGQLPPGITLGTAGVFTGSPSRHGTYNFSLEVRDCLNNSCAPGTQQQVVPKNNAWRVSAKDQQGSSFGGGPVITLGGSPNRKLAQVFTVGAQGSLTAVGITNITCPAAQTPITIDIQRLTQSGLPDGTTIATGTAIGGNFNAIALSPATPVAIGERLAFIVSAGGTLSCTLPSAAAFDNYQAGDGYVSTGGNWSKLVDADVDNNGSVDGVYDLPSWRTTIQPAMDVAYLTTSYTNATTTLLNNGKVLIAGGGSTTALLYDPATNTTSVAGTMNMVRQSATATLLGDGTVLIAGGRDQNSNKNAQAEIYDPVAGTFTPTNNNMANSRDNHRAVRFVVSGVEKVLITGGVNPSGSNLAAVEIYDTATKLFTLMPNSLGARQSHAAVLLNTGKILIAGGYTSSGPSAEVFNPANNSWTATTTSMIVSSRGLTTGTLLSDGRVLITGGQSGDVRNEAEIYDPAVGANGSWSAVGNMSTPRYNHTATLLSNGKVLIAGGFANQTISSWTLALPTMETFDPATGTFSGAGSMETRRGNFAAVRLANGKVFLAGGSGQSWMSGNTAELFDPATAPSFTPTTLNAATPNVAYPPATFTGINVNLNSYTIKHVGGQLPPGMTYTQATRTLSGTPTTAGLYQFALEVSDGPTHLNVQTLTLLVGSVNTITSPYRLPDAPQFAGYTYQLNATGPNNTWTMLPPTSSTPNNTLPPGLTLTAGGLIQGASGTPTLQGYYNFGVRAVDAFGVEAIKVLSISVPGPLTINTLTMNNPELFQTPNCISVSNGVGNKTYSIVSGTLPAGVTFSGTTASTCINFSGQTKQTGTFTFKVHITDQSIIPQVAEQQYTINVYAGDQSNFSTGPTTFDIGPGTGNRLAERLYTAITGTIRAVRVPSMTCTANGTAVSVEIQSLDSSGKPSGQVLATGNGVSPIGTITLNNGVFFAADQSFAIVFDAGNTCSMRPTSFDGYPGEGFFSSGGGAWQRLDTLNPQRFDIQFLTLVEPVSGIVGMNMWRGAHVAAPLANNKVLIAGGCCSPLAEVYDLATNQTTAVGNTTTVRQNAAATTLANGKVLLTGGRSATGVVQSSAEIFDPGTNTFTATPNMISAREQHRATLLNNGKVLITGGFGGAGQTIANAELYDPALNTFAALPDMTRTRQNHTATLLDDGRVLIAGGYGCCAGGFAEIFDPSTSSFTQTTGNMTSFRGRHTATLSSAGTVLITGGTGNNGEVLATAEIFNPSGGGSFTPAPSMSTPRIDHTAVLLGSGQILVSGGYTDNTCCYSHPPVATMERFTAGGFVNAGSMIVSRWAHTATSLGGDKVLFTGTFGWSSAAGRTAELFDAAAQPYLQSTRATGVTGSPLSITLVPAGGSGAPYTMTHVSGTLPPELTLNPGLPNGQISGTPSGPGTYSLVIKVEDGAAHASFETFTLIIDPLTITTSSLPTAFQGSGYTGVLQATGVATITWSLAGGQLPTGLSLNANGTFSGTTNTSCCTYNFTVRATDGIGRSVIKPLSIFAQAPLSISNTTLGDGLAGSTYFGSLFANGGWTNPLAWSISGQPQGLQINASTGQFLTNYPADVLRETGSFTIAAQVTDASNPQQTANKNLALNVYAFEQSTGSLQGQPDISIPSSRKIAQVYQSGTPYGIAAVQPFQLVCDPNVVLTAKVYPVTIGNAPDESGSPLSTGSLTSNPFGFFNNQYLVFSPHVALPPDTKFAVVYSTSGNCTQKDWSIYDYNPRGDAWIDDGSGWTLASTAIGRYDLPHSTLIMAPPSSSLRFLAGWRGAHATAMLNDGRVFMAGSEQYTETYHPATHTFTLTAAMSHAREYATATVLPNGKVLIAGGAYWDYGTNTYHASATTQIFNPATGLLEASQNMSTPRSRHTATLLGNGNVLITGGQDLVNNSWVVIQSADIFDGNGNLVSTINMTGARVDHTATMLTNGKVFIVGGWGGAPGVAEIYDPTSNTFAGVSAAITWPIYHTATLVTVGAHAGQVLITGGSSSTNYPNLSGDSYFFSPISNTFAVAPTLLTSRLDHTANVLPDGRIVFAGGVTEAGNWSKGTRSVEIYDPVTDARAFIGDLLTDRLEHSANVVNTPSGLRLAVVGGHGTSNIVGRTLELLTLPQ